MIKSDHFENGPVCSHSMHYVKVVIFTVLCINEDTMRIPISNTAVMLPGSGLEMCLILDQLGDC